MRDSTRDALTARSIAPQATVVSPVAPARPLKECSRQEANTYQQAMLLPRAGFWMGASLGLICLDLKLGDPRLVSAFRTSVDR
jgi:hypothetical protein